MEVTSDINERRAVLCAVVLRGDRVLLIRSRRHGVATPGGKQEAGETDEDTLRRELREETGMSLVRVCSMLGSARYDSYDLRTYHVDADGDPVAGDDAAEAWWGDPVEVRDSAIPRDYPWILAAIESERAALARRDEAWRTYSAEVCAFAEYRQDVAGGPAVWLSYLANGLCGEASEVDAAPDRDKHLDELADVVWHVATLEHETRLPVSWPGRYGHGRAFEELGQFSPGHDVAAIGIDRLGLIVDHGRLLRAACRLAEVAKRPVRGRDLDGDAFSFALSECATVAHDLARQHGGLEVVLEHSLKKIRSRFGGKPWSAELMRARDGVVRVAEGDAAFMARIVTSPDAARALLLGAHIITHGELYELAVPPEDYERHYGNDEAFERARVGHALRQFAAGGLSKRVWSSASPQAEPVRRHLKMPDHQEGAPVRSAHGALTGRVTARTYDPVRGWIYDVHWTDYAPVPGAQWSDHAKGWLSEDAIVSAPEHAGEARS